MATKRATTARTPEVPSRWDETKQAYVELQPQAFLSVRKIVTEEVPLYNDRSAGITFGGMVDSYINDCLESGEEIQSFEVGFGEGQWSEFVKARA